MTPDPAKPPEKPALIIRPSTDLVRLPDGATSALSEIINRSLVHIQTSKALGMLHRIGEHELYGPDYRLVCIWAEELRQTPEEVLANLLEDSEIPDDEKDDGWVDLRTELVRGRFKSIQLDRAILKVGGFSSIEGLVLQRLGLFGGNDGVFNLDLSRVPNLKELRCTGNQLAELDLSEVPNLTILDCGSNQLAELDLSGVPNLTKLFCGSNQLIELDLSGVPNLTKLFCGSNQLAELNLCGIPNLTGLDCRSNQLADLDLSGISNLTYLNFGWNQLAELDLSGIPNLTELVCPGNQLAELDLSEVPNLTNLMCKKNHLTDLDLSAVPNLTWLDCNDNQLIYLNLSAVPNLKSLNCSGNQLAELDIRPLIIGCYILLFDRAETRLIQRPDQHFR